MLALILLACNGPTRDRAVCSDDVPYLYVRAYEALEVAPDADTDCARTEVGTTNFAGFGEVPLDLGTTYDDLDQGASYTIAGVLDGYETVTYAPERFSRAVFEFGTRHGDVLPGEAGDPVTADEGYVSTVVTPRGVEVTGLAAGLVGEDANELVVRCTDCDVFVPATVSRLRLELVRANLHLCVDVDATITGSLEQTDAQIELSEGVGRWLLRSDERIELGDDRPLQNLSEVDARLITGRGICR